MGYAGRQRAGHGWTSVKERGKWQSYIANDDGDWVHSIVARGWPRCKNCRRPSERLLVGKYCNICYWYGHFEDAIPNATEFWKHKDEWYFPYNIGHRMTARLHLGVGRPFAPCELCVEKGDGPCFAVKGRVTK